MTYLAMQRRYRRKPPGLSGFVDDLMQTMLGKSGEVACVDKANQAVAPVDAKIDDLVRNWNPTGFYTAQEVRNIVAATMKVVQQAHAALDLAAADPHAMQERVMSSANDLARAGGRSLDYLDAARTADQQGLRLVNALGLKRWVTDTLATASSVMVTASVIGCLRPWWVGAMSVFQSAFDVAWALAKRTVGAVLAIGETALKIVDDLPQLYDILKWGALAFGAYWVFQEIRNRSAGHAP